MKSHRVYRLEILFDFSLENSHRAYLCEISCELILFFTISAENLIELNRVQIFRFFIILFVFDSRKISQNLIVRGFENLEQFRIRFLKIVRFSQQAFQKNTL